MDLTKVPILGNVLEPDFERAERVHDWRNHVGERTQAIWATLTPEQRLAIALDAEDDASNEEWE